jgi:predicted RNA-binding Zn-ribbon protein involved in translation (DUF1610 family)
MRSLEIAGIRRCISCGEDLDPRALTCPVCGAINSGSTQAAPPKQARFFWNTYRIHGTDQTFVEVIGHGPFAGRTISYSKGRWIIGGVFAMAGFAALAVLGAIGWGATGEPVFAFLFAVFLLSFIAGAGFLAWTLTPAHNHRA